MGGIFKKGDKLNLKKIDLLNVEAFIYGKNKTPFNKELKNKVKIKNFDNLNKAIKEIFKFIKKKDLFTGQYYLALVQHHLILLKISRKEVIILTN